MVNLVSDVYSVIISHLHRPRPRPTGRNERSTIRQPELANCMRVSKLFNNLTAPYLYTIVITDNLPLLAHNLEASASAKGIRSKRQLLSFTKRLFLEYSNKSPPSYTSLMLGDPHGFKLFWLVGEVNTTALNDLCWLETWALASSAQSLKPYLKLSTLSLGAFLPSQVEIWEPMKNFPMANEKLSKKQELLASAQEKVSALGKTENGRRPVICHRIAYGPLTCVVGIFEEGVSYPDPKHSVHIESPLTYKTIPTVLGGKSAWYCSESLWTNGDIDIDDDFIRAVSRQGSVREIFRGRRADTNKKGKEGMDDRDMMSVDLYIPAKLINKSNLSDDLEQIMEGAYDQLEKKKPNYTKEEWRPKKIEDAPRCKACDWCFEDEKIIPVKRKSNTFEPFTFRLQK